MSGRFTAILVLVLALCEACSSSAASTEAAVLAQARSTDKFDSVRTSPTVDAIGGNNGNRKGWTLCLTLLGVGGFMAVRHRRY